MFVMCQTLPRQSLPRQGLMVSDPAVLDATEGQAQGPDTVDSIIRSPQVHEIKQTYDGEHH